MNSMRWIQRTGQQWKIRLSLSVFTVAGLGIFWLLFFPSPHFLKEGSVRSMLLAVWALALAWFVAAVRCPSCRTSIGWWAFSTKNGIVRLFALETCPICGDGTEH
jgi:hypothetical protein